MTDRPFAASGMKVCETEFSSLDGLRLSGTQVFPPDARHTVVLVHGAGATRDEGGLFTRLALDLADAGIASLRFDLRAHGRSEGGPQDLTLAGVVNDIRAAVDLAGCCGHDGPVGLVGVGFGAGASALFAASYPQRIRRLALIDPLLDCKRHLVDDNPCWTDDRIAEDVGRELAAQGFIAHSPSFGLGRSLLNEIFYLRPDEALGQVVTPTLIVHGTAGSQVPIEGSREQHRFAGWQALVVRSIGKWVTGS